MTIKKSMQRASAPTYVGLYLRSVFVALGISFRTIILRLQIRFVAATGHRYIQNLAADHGRSLAGKS